MAKRTLHSFFKPIAEQSPKRSKPDPSNEPQSESQNPESSEPEPSLPPDTHPTYPIPIPQLPSHILVALQHGTPFREPRTINNQPHLDLLHFEPYIARTTANQLFKFLRASLPFYRVQYQIKRDGYETQINTPRFTTVFGVDETSRFETSTQSDTYTLINAETKTPSKTKYQYPPRPIPSALDELRKTVEAATGARYNFCLVNYYASGEDSIAFHSDDERFLGEKPNIASLSLGGEREFQMKHKPDETDLKRGVGQTQKQSAPQLIKMGLKSGDMVVMRGDTQANWLHSIPKRRGRAGDAVRARINITFRKAVVPAGTNNYYHYNVGSGPVYRWDEGRGVMDLMKAGS